MRFWTLSWDRSEMYLASIGQLELSRFEVSRHYCPS